MTKTALLFAALLATAPLSAQDTKGAHPINQSTNQPVNHTRAVVVGISDYQDPTIPDLRFADRDAEAFANWLRSPAGGNVPESHLQVLLNSDATAGKIIAALGGLVTDCKPGDQAVIYFSGHGDVERISKFQRGFWLSWDSPPAVYAAGGTCALGYLQDIISTLSDAGVQVVVVADACRAGKLAGSAVGGTQASSAALAQQFANEVKILSCQPEEFSLEGEQWGGGRGVFSYHLVDALYGMADANTDGTVNLLELGRYLEDRVPAETAPHSQIPFTVGGKATPIARVDAAQLAAWKKQKTSAMPTFNKIDSKSLEDLALADADSSVQALYREFLAALKRGDLMEARDGVSPSADTLYKRLIQEPVLADLHGLMTRNFAAALMDKGQQVLNRYLNGDLHALESIDYEIGINHRSLAEQFYRAAELLGEKHYYHASTKAKGLYFEAKAALYRWNISQDSADSVYAKRLLQAVAADQTAAYAWLALCSVMPADSLERYIERLNELVPNWPIFHNTIGKLMWKSPDKALSYYQKALAIDSTFLLALSGIINPLKKLGRNQEAAAYREAMVRIGLLKMEQHPDRVAMNEWYILRESLKALSRPKEVEQLDMKFIATDSTSSRRWFFLGREMNTEGRYGEAEQAFLKSLALDSNGINNYHFLGWVYYYQKRYGEMEQMFRKVLTLTPNYGENWNGLGWALLSQKKYEDADKAFLQSLAITNNHSTAAALNGLAQTYLGQKRYAEAEQVSRRFIESSPNSSVAWSGLGSALYNAGKYAEAISVYRRLVELDSANIGYRNYLSSALIRTHMFEEAIEVCQKAIAIDSTNVTAWNNLGYALLQTRHYSESESALRRSISLNLKSANAHKHLATLHFRTGRREEARQGFEKALELNPDYIGGYLGMAYLYAAEGKTSEALEYVEQAIRKNATLEQLEDDDDLAPLRDLPEWRALMEKHFPDQAKD